MLRSLAVKVSTIEGNNCSVKGLLILVQHSLIVEGKDLVVKIADIRLVAIRLRVAIAVIEVKGFAKLKEVVSTKSAIASNFNSSNSFQLNSIALPMLAASYLTLRLSAC